MGEALPSTIGRYEIRREIGHGSMGVVFEAHDPLLDRAIALKTFELRFPVAPEELSGFEQRFFSEARIAARLAHPNIVTVHDVGRDATTLYVALELLHGRTLEEILRGGVTLEWREALTIVRQVAEGLHHAHTHRVIHRDIKPANIMVLSSGVPKIMDFGIAKLDTARLKLTGTGQFLGTPLYTAPEQVLGREFDGRTDLFSLGAVAYEMLTGERAFAAPNVPAIIQRILCDDPLTPSQLVPDLPTEVDYVVCRSLAKSPVDRYPDAATLAADIEDLLAGRPALPPCPGAETISLEEELAGLVEPDAAGAAPESGSLARPRENRSRHAIRNAAAAFLSLTVLGGVALLFLRHDRHPSPPSASPPLKSVPRTDEPRVDKSQGTVTILDKSPDPQKRAGHFPVTWCKPYSEGRIFYTSLGHREDIIDTDPDLPGRKNSVEISKTYQAQILGGIEWALKLKNQTAAAP